MRYELTIGIKDKKYVDMLIICLARQGYAPYITEDGDVCITIYKDDLVEIKNANKS